MRSHLLQIHDLDDVLEGIVEIGAPPAKRSLHPVLFLENPHALRGEIGLGVVVGFSGHAERRVTADFLVQRPPTVNVADVVVSEGGLATFTVTRTGASDVSQTVDVSTLSLASPDTAEVADFTALSTQTLTFAAGVSTQTFTVQTTQDTTYEGAETFRVQLANATSGALISTTNGTATSKSARLLAVTGDSLGTIVDCAFGADDAKTGTVAAPTCTSTSWTSKGNLLPKAAWNYTAAFTPKDGTKVDDVWSALPGVSMQRKAGNNTLTGSVGVVISDADATEYFGADGQTFSTALYSWAADTAKTASVVAAKAPTTVSINTKTGKVEARSIVAAASNATNATTSATALVGAISTVAVSAMIALF